MSESGWQINRTLYDFPVSEPAIIALDVDTGAYAWHYQEVPGEEWDYDATSPLMLADLKLAVAPFELGGQQYIAEEVGYGLAPYGTPNQSRLLVFKLGGTAALPPAPPPPSPKSVLNPPPSSASAFRKVFSAPSTPHSRTRTCRADRRS